MWFGYPDKLGKVIVRIFIIVRLTGNALETFEASWNSILFLKLYIVSVDSLGENEEFFFPLIFYLFEWVSEKEGEKSPPLAGSFSKWLQQPGLGQAEVMSVFWVCFVGSGPEYVGHTLLLSQGALEGDGLLVKQLRHECCHLGGWLYPVRAG